jgi:hypothetical protein
MRRVFFCREKKPQFRTGVYWRSEFKIKSVVKNRVYTGKTHLRGFKIVDF